MRIIGGKDYYDGAMAHGQDREVVFLRKRHEDAPLLEPGSAALGDLSKLRVRFGGDPLFRRHDNVVVAGDSEFRFHPLCVWVAGRRHGGLGIDLHADRWRPYASRSTHVFWDRDACLTFLLSHGLAPAPRRRGRFAEGLLDDAGLDAHFADAGSEAARDWMIGAGASVAIWHRAGGEAGWKVDTDGLKLLEFSRKLDPWTTFQELAMWVGGVLPRPGAPTVELTGEKVMVAKHGFDEWSFRRKAASSRP